jgi:uncharacterized protein
MQPQNDFRAAWWLPGPHPQTVWGRLVRSRRQVALRRERLETPDGDELVLDHVEGRPGCPRLFVLHGLEGSSYSVYVQGLLAHARRRGLSATAMNFRSCARDPGDLSRMLPNRKPRLYHSGETGDFDFAVRVLAAREPGAPLVAAGVSLGGNVLLKWLGENPQQRIVQAAAALSTPYDLGASARYLESAPGRLYVGHFLSTLKEKARATAERFPEAAAKMDVRRALAARTFRDFDDAANAPLHGFTGADDYYRRASSLGFLARVATPCLCVSAEDDPFLPREALARARATASLAIDFRVTPRGGHIGWVSGRVPWLPVYWVEDLTVEWLLGTLAGEKKRPGSGLTAPPAGERTPNGASS